MSSGERRIREIRDKASDLYAWASWPLRWAWLMCLNDYNFGDKPLIHRDWERYDELLGNVGELLPEQQVEFRRLFQRGMAFLLDQGYVDPVRVDRYDWPVIERRFMTLAIDLINTRSEIDRSHQHID